jgi:hypothetical protein
MLPFLIVGTEQFSVIRGAPIAFASSPSVTRRFCGQCGSPLTYQSADRPDRIDVMTCSLDDSDAFPPTFHVWVGDKLAWEQVSDGLPAYATTRAAGILRTTGAERG